MESISDQSGSWLLLHDSHVPHIGAIHSNIGQGQRAMVPIFARNTFLAGAILVNCLENERTGSCNARTQARSGFEPLEEYLRSRQGITLARWERI